jgi:hypothetical protein
MVEGLVGAIVGAVLGLGGRAFIERRREARRTRAAAQAVHMELLNIYAYLEGAVTGQAPFPVSDGDQLPVGAWNAHRHELVPSLGSEMLSKVITAYRQVEWVNTLARSSGRRRRLLGGVKAIKDPELFSETATEVWMAVEVLAELAGYRPIDRPELPKPGDMLETD